MADVLAMMRSGSNGPVPGFGGHVVTSSCHRGSYVVLSCVWIRLFGVAPCPDAFVIPATVEAPMLRSLLTGTVSSHQTTRYAYYKKRGIYNHAYDYRLNSCRHVLLWLARGPLGGGLRRLLRLVDLLGGGLGRPNLQDKKEFMGLLRGPCFRYPTQLFGLVCFSFFLMNFSENLAVGRIPLERI
jgi:hypothetical protein